jgi:thiol-disulfide isomerase/thioredoxin
MKKLRDIFRSPFFQSMVLATILLVWMSGCSKTTVRDNTLNLDVTDVDGNRVTLDDARFDGKVVLVNIFGTWCPPCQQEVPHLVALQNQYRDQGFEIVAVSFEGQTPYDLNELLAFLKRFKERKGINYLVTTGGESVDVPDVMPDVENFKGFPTNIYIGRDKKVRHVTRGFFEGEEVNMAKRIETLLNESAR